MKLANNEKQDENRQAARELDREEGLLGPLTRECGPAPGGVKSRRNSGTDRRQRHVWSFLYGGLNPRRRDHRRGVDDHNLYVDWHESSLLWPALAIVLMSCLDALFTLNLMAVGAEEINWFMKGLIEENIGRFLSVKIALTGFGVVILVAASRYRLMGRRIVKGLFQAICGIYVVLLGYELMLLSPHIEAILAPVHGVDLNVGTLFIAGN